ncbi:MAG: hypothetical protein IAC08_07180 [Bacteroidetes bacterium]|uniref:BACON domain-containing protein n=1 Tax=Candidatus Cryptobacteroides intestinigallinarum TaxID=2840767 RepID=A0A9D9N0T9_9BACT|nr:hypothetical protein [Candidatus Cryptobacteroides intestinigallinarum]
MRILIRFLLFLSLASPFLVTGCAREEVSYPEISFSPVPSVSPDGGEYEIPFTIRNAFEYAIMRCASDQPWLHDVECLDDRIVFVADMNDGLEPRSAKLKVTYPECDDIVLKVTQEAYDQTGGMKINISVELTGARTAKAGFSPLDKEQTYYTGYTLESDILSYGGDDAAFMQGLVEQMEQEALQTGLRLNAVIRKYVVSGDSSMDIEGLQPETDYCVFAFSLDTDGTFHDNLTVETFRSGSFEYPGATFSISVKERGQSSLGLVFAPDTDGITYIPSIIPVSEYESVMGSSDELLMAAEIQECQAMIDYYASYGITWTFLDFTSTGVSETEFDGLLPGHEYYAYAFGIDADGVPVTPLSKQKVSTEPVTVTDDCTFSLSFSDIRSQSIDVTVVPSNPSTRYYLYLADSGILVQNTPEDIAALIINMASESGINWADSPYVRTGTQTLDSTEDLNAVQLQADTEYTVFVFGINAEGERTTEVSYASCRTARVQSSDMTISFTIRDLRPGSATVTYVPSADEPYLYGCVEKSVYDGYPDDASFIGAMVVEAGQNGTLIPVTGEYTQTYGGNILRADREYVVYAFGYAGGVSTGLFMDVFRTPERVFSSASLDITWSIRDGNELYAENPQQNFDFQNNAAITFTVTPSGASSWYFSGFGNSRSYLESLDEEELLYTIYSNGRKNYNKTAVTYAVAWNSVLCGAGYGMDAGGNEGKPVIVEVQVPPSAAYLK